MSDIECPRCGTPHEPSGSHEDDSGEWECDSCAFTFVVEIEYEPIYTARCKEHTWGEWQDTVYEFDRWRVCLTCDWMEMRSNDEST